MLISVLVSLIIFCLILGIVFWLVGMILSGIPGAPPFLKGVIMALIALCALIYLFGGYAPWWGHHRIAW